MIVLVLNSGSSSIKFQAIETSLDHIEENADRTLARGIVDRVGLGGGMLRYEPEGRPSVRDSSNAQNHQQALEEILAILTKGEHAVLSRLQDIGAVGHRVVHGGEHFAKSAIITPEAERNIEECVDLAPLHNPHNLRGIRRARMLLPAIPHVAVFDTAFHQAMPPHVFLYGLPYSQYTRHGVRRYGFHGTSHRYNTYRLHRLLGVPRFGVNAITCHLGNGCSVAAVRDGVGIDTSMGLTPMEGLLMGTRSGDLDPGVLYYLMGKEDLTLVEVNTMLNKHSGLLGVSGIGSDMRELLAAAAKGNDRAETAIRMFCYRAAKYIGGYLTVVGEDLHAITFTGGIGENSPEIRHRIVSQLKVLGIYLDEERNASAIAREQLISADGSRFPVYAIPTNEELVIARDTIRAIEGVL
ncbi:acetate kinase [Candidatus Poribacteria bacterium]|nr:acetate kinase [Candidatus Poribacteria bacterium]